MSDEKRKLAEVATALQFASERVRIGEMKLAPGEQEGVESRPQRTAASTPTTRSRSS